MIYLPRIGILGELLGHLLVLQVKVRVCVPIQCPRKSAKRTPFSLVAVCLPPPQVALHSECDHEPHSQSTAEHNFPTVISSVRLANILVQSACFDILGV